MISASTAAVSLGRSGPRPDASASIALVRMSFGIWRITAQEVREQPLALVGQHRLGMELHALGGQLAVAQAHQHAAARAPTLRGSPAARDPRRASGSARPSAARRSPRKIVRPSCSITVALPCTGGCSATRPAERLRERLVAEADAERRNPRLAASAAPPRARSPPRRGCTAPARPRSARSPARAARRRWRGRCAPCRTSAPSSPRYCTRLYVNES